MSIVLVGSTSGSITLQEPAVAGTTTINLPATTGTVVLQNASNNLLMNSGYGSDAVAYGCRAWVNFNGTGTVAIRASGNVTSITDVGTGRYRLNFTNSLSDVNYAVNITGDASAGIVGSSIASIAGPTTSVYEFGTYSTGFTLQDCSFVNASVFR
jgi:hypothetical protein